MGSFWESGCGGRACSIDQVSYFWRALEYLAQGNGMVRAIYFRAEERHDHTFLGFELCT